jgi:16S rRNA (adenine1518-N6/adenine1519-N6)-dimethyltransferase
MKDFDYKKSLGQNFLIDNNIIKKISDSINASKDDLIIEIGPGSGALTKELIKKGSDVICFEIDKRLEPILTKLNSDNLKIVFEDFLKIKINEHTKGYSKLFFVGNLPYYITTAIINKIINESNPSEIIIMVQKEVADRIMAKPNSKEYNSLSVFLQYNFEIKKICNVSKYCFNPIPKVDSTVVKFTRNKMNIASNEEKFYKLVKDSFSQKRKNLRNNLKSYDLKKIDSILKQFNKDLSKRAEQLTIEEFVEISNKLF